MHLREFGQTQPIQMLPKMHHDYSVQRRVEQRFRECEQLRAVIRTGIASILSARCYAAAVAALLHCYSQVVSTLAAARWRRIAKQPACRVASMTQGVRGRKKQILTAEHSECAGAARIFQYCRALTVCSCRGRDTEAIRSRSSAFALTEQRIIALAVLACPFVFI